MSGMSYTAHNLDPFAANLSPSRRSTSSPFAASSSNLPSSPAPVPFGQTTNTYQNRAVSGQMPGYPNTRSKTFAGFSEQDLWRGDNPPVPARRLNRGFAPYSIGSGSYTGGSSGIMSGYGQGYGQNVAAEPPRKRTHYEAMDVDEPDTYQNAPSTSMSSYPNLFSSSIPRHLRQQPENIPLPPSPIKSPRSDFNPLKAFGLSREEVVILDENGGEGGGDTDRSYGNMDVDLDEGNRNANNIGQRDGLGQGIKMSSSRSFLSLGKLGESLGLTPKSSMISVASPLEPALPPTAAAESQGGLRDLSAKVEDGTPTKEDHSKDENWEEEKIVGEASGKEKRRTASRKRSIRKLPKDKGTVVRRKWGNDRHDSMPDDSTASQQFHLHQHLYSDHSSHNPNSNLSSGPTKLQTLWQQPHILTSYLRFIFHLSLLIVSLYFLTTFTLFIRADIIKALSTSENERRMETLRCGNLYSLNGCDKTNRAPALDEMCREWERCLTFGSGVGADGQAVGVAGTAARVLAETVNSFVEVITWRTMMFIVVSISAVVYTINKSLSPSVTSTHQHHYAAGSVHSNGHPASSSSSSSYNPYPFRPAGSGIPSSRSFIGYRQDEQMGGRKGAFQFEFGKDADGEKDVGRFDEVKDDRSSQGGNGGRMGKSWWGR